MKKISLNQAVQFDISRLFNGAIDVDWLVNDPNIAASVARSFVFHGPAYHGVTQTDVIETGHKLIDSASFVKETVQGLVSGEANAFTLAIAGFGSGKSHMAVTLTELLETQDVAHRATILKNLAQADASIAEHVERLLPEVEEKVLVITLNGMKNFDLASQLLKQAKGKLQKRHLSTDALEGVRKRFEYAAKVLSTLNCDLLPTLLDALNLSDVQEVLKKLVDYDEQTYKQVHQFLSEIGIPLQAIGDETAKDVLTLLATNYVGEGKPFKKILILFDEFGRYLEFATAHSHIAGNGALQQFYEGVQKNSAQLTFVGFIQYELKAYVQRLPIEFKNDITRFITRFQTSDKKYLSINLETLIANLLVKDSKEVLSNEVFLNTSFQQIQRWYPNVAHHSLWHSPEMFKRVIGEGCWPLSPLVVWFLFYLSAGGQYLQQRSALALLKVALDMNSGYELSDEKPVLPVVRLWSEELQSELQDVEEKTGRGAVMQSYVSVFERHRQHLVNDDILLLRSIVMLSVTRLKATSREDAIKALQEFSGIEPTAFARTLNSLEEELNVITWDDTFHQFDIIGDSVSKSQFMKFLRNKLVSEYNLEQQEKLFIKKAEFFSDVLGDIACDFGSNNNIVSAEWRYESRYTYWGLFVQMATNLIVPPLFGQKYNQVDVVRGLVIYCYVSENEDIKVVMQKSVEILRKVAKDNGVTHLPVMLVLLHDQDGEIGRTIAELDILEKLSLQEQEMYGKIASIHRLKREENLRTALKKVALERNYETTLKGDFPTRLSKLGDALFDKIYPKPLSFPFDGYHSARSNAAKDCRDLTRNILFNQNFTYSVVQSLPIQQRNRANNVLKNHWKVFNMDGSLSSSPGLSSARNIVTEWEKLLQGTQELNCGEALAMACAAPYGANIASAGLLFVIYVQTRRETTSLTQKDGQAVDFASLNDQLFEGNVFATKTLESLTLHKVENSGSEWEILLNEWGNADSYVKIVELEERAIDLERRLKVPQTLGWKYNTLKRSAKDAKKKIDEADEKEDKALKILESGANKKDLSILSFGASLLQACAQRKHKDPMWKSEDYEWFKDRLLQARLIIEQNFESWLHKQQPNGLNMAALLTFKEEVVDRVVKNLKNIDLHSQADALNKHYERMSRAFDAIVDAKQTLSALDAWLVSNSKLSRDLTISQIKTQNQVLMQQMELLKQSRSNMIRLNNQTLIQEFDQKIANLKQLNQELKDQENKISKRAQAIWNSKLSTESVDDLLEQVKEMEHLYAEDGSNVEDFRQMRTILQTYLDTWRRLKFAVLNQNDFQVQLSASRQDFLCRFSHYELPWDLEEAFGLLEQECEVSKQQASQKWVQMVQCKLVQLAQMTTIEVNELQRNISNPPACVDLAKESTFLEKAQDSIHQFLNTKEVEWLLERFKQMSKTAQKDFIKAIGCLLKED